MKKYLIYLVKGTFVIYLIALFYLTFLRQRGWWSDMTMIEYALSQMNLIPFKTIGGYVAAIFNESMNLSIPVTNLLGNFFMFMPMGIYLPWIFKKVDSWKIYVTIIVAILFIIEITQLFTKHGAFDIDDFILNLAGATVGFIIWKIAKLIYLNKRIEM